MQVNKMPKPPSIVETHPEIAAEWDYEANGSLKPEHVSYGMRTKANWVCENGHKWATSINNRFKNSVDKPKGCPYCSGRYPIVGLNDLSTTHPEIAKEWDTELNVKLPSQVLHQSNYVAKWICPKGHKYSSRLDARTRQGSGCPFCSGRYAIKGETDLATLRPDILNEWDYEKNEKQPYEFVLNSHARVNWVCSKGHKWEAVIAKRTHSGRNCPTCALATQTSKIEIAFFNALLPILSDCKNSFKLGIRWSKGNHFMTVDIKGFYEGKTVIVEYDGFYFHNSPKKEANDLEKSLACLDEGYLVIRIRGKGLPALPITNSRYVEFEHKENRPVEPIIDQIKNWLK